MIEIDGSYGEGGGQVMRTALALSTVTGKPFRIKDIRKKRPKPGLSAQHLTCIKVCRDFSEGTCEDVAVGSESFEFHPGKKINKDIRVDIGTAGSITLLLQSIMLPAIVSGKKVKLSITGGTDVKWSMPADYFTNVLVPYLRNFARIEVRILRRGYYPKGNGSMEVRIEGISDPKKLELTERGDLLMIKGVSHASKDLMDKKVSERQADSARNYLKGYQTDIMSSYSESASSGSGITLWAVFSGAQGRTFVLGSDSLGKKGKSSELVGKEAAAKILEEIKGGYPIDEFISDNLIPYIAYFGGVMKIPEITGHVKSNIYVTDKFLKIEVKNNIMQASPSSGRSSAP